jgi:hypothetical protein
MLVQRGSLPRVGSLEVIMLLRGPLNQDLHARPADANAFFNAHPKMNLQ